MDVDVEVRVACEADAPGISQVILAALESSNAKDYSPAVIERVGRSFSPGAVLALIGSRQVFVAVSQHAVVGTASLDGAAVRSVFVVPQVQGAGIGRLLMAAVERAARSQKMAVLRVPSSLTAEGFYSRLGFSKVREQLHGDELTIVMELSLE